MFEFARNFINNVNWGEHAANLSKRLNELVSNINWGGVGETLASFINALINGASGFISNFDWATFATNIAKTVNSMITHIEWRDLGKTINNFIGGLLDGAIAFIKNTDWKNVGNKIYEFMSQIDFVDIFLKIGRLILAAAQGMLQAVTTALNGSGLGNYGKGSTISGDHGNNPAIKLTPTVSKSTFRASGGYPEQGSMFIAGEAGAEFVGNINGKTGVMNTDQFGDVMRPTTNAIYEIGNAIVSAVSANKDVYIDGKNVTGIVRTNSSRINRAYGV